MKTIFISWFLFLTVFVTKTHSQNITDSRDGKIYKTTQINKQVWMAESLNFLSSSGSWCYENKQENCDIYGRLYDWQTAKQACPGGWHLPSDAEWKILESFLGISKAEIDSSNWRGTEEGIALREVGTKHWKCLNEGTNSMNFTALPGGFRNQSETYDLLGYLSYFWSSTEQFATYAWIRYLAYDNVGINRNFYDKISALSVRCIKDENVNDKKKGFDKPQKSNL